LRRKRIKSPLAKGVPALAGEGCLGSAAIRIYSSLPRWSFVHFLFAQKNGLKKGRFFRRCFFKVQAQNLKKPSLKTFLGAFEILPYKSPPVLRRGLGWYKIKIFQKLVLFRTVPLIPRLFMPTRTKKEEKPHQVADFATWWVRGLGVEAFSRLVV